MMARVLFAAAFLAYITYRATVDRVEMKYFSRLKENCMWDYYFHDTWITGHN